MNLHLNAWEVRWGRGEAAGESVKLLDWALELICSGRQTSMDIYICVLKFLWGILYYIYEFLPSGYVYIFVVGEEKNKMALFP